MSLNLKSENKDMKKHGLIFNLELTDILRLTMFGTLVAIVNDITRLPLQLPGHTSIWWMGLLLVGKGLIPKKGAGTIMGSVSGILAVLLGMGDKGAFFFFTYFIPGLMLDIIVPLFNYKLESPVIGAICAAIASAAKMFANLAAGIALHLPMVFLTLGLGFTAVSHVIFGAIGGVLATFLIKRLKPRLLSWD